MQSARSGNNHKPSENRRAQILNVIREASVPLNATEVHEKLGVSYEKLRKNLTWMKANGDLVIIAPWGYWPTDTLLRDDRKIYYQPKPTVTEDQDKPCPKQSDCQPEPDVVEGSPEFRCPEPMVVCENRDAGDHPAEHPAQISPDMLRDWCEHRLLGILLASPSLVPAAAAVLLPDEIGDAGLRRILAELFSLWAAGILPDLESLQERLLDRPDLFEDARSLRDISCHLDGEDLARVGWLSAVMNQFTELKTIKV